MKSMTVGAMVRFSGGYGSDTFEVVAVCGSNVGIRALANGATLAVGECTIVAAADLWVYREAPAAVSLRKSA